MNVKCIVIDSTYVNELQRAIFDSESKLQLLQ